MVRTTGKSTFKQRKMHRAGLFNFMSFLLMDHNPVQQKPPFLPCNFQTTKRDESINKLLWGVCWLVEELVTREGERQENSSLLSAYNVSHSPYLIHRNPFFIAMVQLRLVQFSDLLKVTQVISGQTGPSIWFFLNWRNCTTAIANIQVGMEQTSLKEQTKVSGKRPGRAL